MQHDRASIEKRYYKYYEDGHLSSEERKGLCDFLEKSEEYTYLRNFLRSLRYTRAFMVILAIFLISMVSLGSREVHIDVGPLITFADYLNLIQARSRFFLFAVIVIIFFSTLFFWRLLPLGYYLYKKILIFRGDDYTKYRTFQSDIIETLIQHSSVPLHNFSFDDGNTGFPFAMIDLQKTLPWIRPFDRVKKFSDMSTISGSTLTHHTPYTAQGIEIQTQKRYKDGSVIDQYVKLDYCYLFMMHFQLHKDHPFPTTTLQQEEYYATRGRRKKTLFGRRYVSWQLGVCLSTLLVYILIYRSGVLSTYEQQWQGDYPMWRVVAAISCVMFFVIGSIGHVALYKQTKDREIDLVAIDFDDTFLLQSNNPVAANLIFDSTAIRRLQQVAQLLRHRALSLYLDKDTLYVKVDLRSPLYRLPSLQFGSKEGICDASIEAFITIRELMKIPDILNLDPYIAQGKDE